MSFIGLFLLIVFFPVVTLRRLSGAFTIRSPPRPTGFDWEFDGVATPLTK